MLPWSILGLEKGGLKNVLQLLDANCNRAREGIRTAEDFIRFEIRSQLWAERLRNMRLQVTRVIASELDQRELIASRRVKQDVGRPESQSRVAAEKKREASKDVALRGLKRAQEAVRVLEEYSRAENEAVSREFSEIRFGLYEAEQWLVKGSEATRLLEKATLYVLISAEQCSLGLEKTALAVIRGGAGILQLREKNLGDIEFLDRAALLKEICASQGVLFVVNDRADVAQAVGADGVHLGQGDLPPERVRPWVGEQLMIGRSTHGVDEARRALEEGANYIAVGAMFESSSKTDTTAAGPEMAGQVLDLGLPIPVFAIGGIDRDRIKYLKLNGVSRVAVSSAVISDADPESAARDIVDALRE